MTTITGIHPHAECYPMLNDDELAALAEDIRENGLRDPVTVTPDGVLIDGRNRAAACALLGVEPETVEYDGDDVGALVRSRNMRRHQPVGSLAMSTALSMQADGLRNDGRWTRNSIRSGESATMDGGWKHRIKEAGIILDFKSELAPLVVSGAVALSNAFEQADAIRRSAEADKVHERELRRREREESKADAERNARIVADLTEAGQGKYLGMVEGGTLTPTAAWAAYQEDTRKERHHQAQLDRGYRDTCTRIAECVRHLNGGEQYANIFLTDSYPHEDRFLAEGMRLTPERIDSAIEFLTTIRKAIH